MRILYKSNSRKSPTKIIEEEMSLLKILNLQTVFKEIENTVPKNRPVNSSFDIDRNVPLHKEPKIKIPIVEESSYYDIYDRAMLQRELQLMALIKAILMLFREKSKRQ